ncbi:MULTISPECIES: hypothetical protein [unclassified Lysinibacillus]|uniref:hypothetical protein n=1 Tax=unclassified Lysinibacillus TaxID=2636778 RepID=UPI00380193B7
MKKIIMVVGYSIFLTTFLFLSLKTLIFSTMSESFPNAPFFLSLLLIIAISVMLGLLLRKFASDSKQLFLWSTVISWIFALAIFWGY